MESRLSDLPHLLGQRRRRGCASSGRHPHLHVGLGMLALAQRLWQARDLLQRLPAAQ